MLLYQDLSDRILDGMKVVNNSLGPGLLETCYHNALLFELRSQGLIIDSEKSYKVLYKDQLVGLYYADLVVEDKIIIECKASKILTDLHWVQTLNYLHISGLQLGYLVNFGKKSLQWKRFVL